MEDLDYFWTSPEIEQFLEKWNEGYSMKAIAQHLNRDIDEVTMLLIEIGRLDHHLIKYRSHGAMVSESVKVNSFYKKRMNKFLQLHPTLLLFEDYRGHFFWTHNEIDRFKNLWSQGLSIEQISGHLKRPAIETMFLMFDLVRTVQIQERS